MSTTGTITSQGIGSGLDIASIITKLMSVEQQPLNTLDTKEASYQTKLTAFGTLQGAFSAVQSAATAMKSSLLFKNMTATPGDSSILTASATTAASAGDYSINVVARAQGETIASQSFASMVTPNAAADGKLKIELGTFTGGTFTGDTSKTPVTIDISQASSSLNGIRDAINAANAGVTARIVDVGGGNYKLLVSSNSTGAITSMKITALDSSGTPLPANNTGLAQFNFDPAAAAGSGNEYAVTMAAQDAHIKLNNLDIYRSTNTISDAITGVTFTLKSEGTTSLTVAKDTSGIGNAIDAFVKAYNTAAQQVRQQTAYNSTTGKGSTLTGDSTARSLQTALGDMIDLTGTTESSSVSSLSDIGITIQRDGTLAFDSSKLATALSSDQTAVAQLLTGGYKGSTGIATRISASLDSIMDTTNGLFATATDSINSTIKSIGDQRTALTLRLQQIQANYQQQFSAMDSAVASWNSTSSYLSQQLSALTNSSKNK